MDRSERVAENSASLSSMKCLGEFWHFSCFFIFILLHFLFFYVRFYSILFHLFYCLTFYYFLHFILVAVRSVF